MLVDLKQLYFHNGTCYRPGLREMPKEAVEALNLSGSEVKPEAEQAEEPKPSTKRRTRRTSKKASDAE